MRELVERLQKDIQDLVDSQEEVLDGMVSLYSAETDEASESSLRAIAEMALIKAARKYPLDSEHKFSSYAVWWVSVALRQELGLPLEDAELV